MHLTFINKYNAHDNSPYTLSLNWITPDGFAVEGSGKSVFLNHWTRHSVDLPTEVDFVIKVGENVDAKNRVVLEVECDTRPSVLYVPITLLA